MDSETKLKIMLIEPNTTSQIMEKMMFESMPMIGSVDIFSTPVAALNKLHEKSSEQNNDENNDYSIIFLNAYMPLLSGFDFIKNLEMRNLLDIPVIMFSTDLSLSQKALETGAFAFVKKPLDFKEVENVISQAASMVL